VAFETLSVVIAAKNCADRIAGTVQPWLWAHEVIVADQMSTDDTAGVATRAGAKVWRNDPPGGNFDVNRKLAMSRATGQWILYIDTDERPTEALIEELKAFLAAPPASVSGMRIPNDFYFLGGPIKHGIYNRRHAEIRLVRQGLWFYPCEEGFHRGVTVKSGEVGRLHQSYRHFNVNGLSEWFLKTNQYTELDAAPSRISTWGALIRFKLFFFKHYFWKLGFLDGWRGFLATWYFGMYHFTLAAKSWEKAQLSSGTEGKDYLKPLPPPGR
jgi:glycosyltransferase involved in cell wall biosynthesis